MFSQSGVQTPCVGVSIGVERVFSIMERKAEELKLLHHPNIQVYIASIGSELLPVRMRVARQLWNNNISAEYSHLDNPKFKKQLDDALERHIPYMVIIGKDELVNGIVKVKNMLAHSEEEVSIDEIASFLIKNGCLPIPAGCDVSFLQMMKN